MTQHVRTEEELAAVKVAKKSFTEKYFDSEGCYAIGIGATDEGKYCISVRIQKEYDTVFPEVFDGFPVVVIKGDIPRAL